MPISTTDLAFNTAMQASQDARKLAWLMQGVVKALHAHGLVYTCLACKGAGHIPPATLVPCKSCDGAGFKPTEPTQ